MGNFVINKKGYYVAEYVSFLSKFDLIDDSETIILKTYNRYGGALKNYGKKELGYAKKLFGDKWIKLAYKESLDGICTVIVGVKERV